jgi:hypothetical protein
MSGISDQFTTIGVEAVAWGTKAATLTRGIEAETSSKPSPAVEQRPSTGMRPGFLGDPSDRHVVDVRGGTYSLACDLLSKSHSMLLGGLNTPVITTPGGATNARLHTITPSDHDLPSQTIHDGIALDSGTIDHINALGAKMTSLKLAVSPKGNVKVTADYSYRTLDTAAASVTPVYASAPYPFRDTDVTTTLGGTPICQRGIDLTIPTGAKVDRDMVCPGGREEPFVLGRVQPTGTLNQDLPSFDYLDAWLNGTPLSLVFYIEGPEIEEGFPYFLRVTYAAVRFTGEAPDRSMTELSGQTLPWQAFDNGTDPLWKIEYQTTDTAL